MTEEFDLEELEEAARRALKAIRDGGVLSLPSQTGEYYWTLSAEDVLKIDGEPTAVAGDLGFDIELIRAEQHENQVSWNYIEAVANLLKYCVAGPLRRP